MDLKKMFNAKNVSEKEKVARLTVGMMFFAGGVMSESALVGLIGLAVFITGIRGNCFLYSLRDHLKKKK